LFRTKTLREWWHMAPRMRIALLLATLVVCVGCDQKTKYLAKERLGYNGVVTFFGGSVRLEYTENEGAFLGWGASLPAPWRTALFTIGCSAGVAAILWYTIVALRAGYLQVVGLSLICAGGIGNLIDRWAFGYTRDFLNVGLGAMRTGIFNVADVALMAGCLLVLFSQHQRVSPKSG
jgi:signal peptidase II